MAYNRQTKKEKESKQRERERERERVCHLWGLVSEREREGAS